MERGECALKIIEVRSEKLEYISEYSSLRTTVTKNGKINHEIQNRVKKAGNVYYLIKML